MKGSAVKGFYLGKCNNFREVLGDQPLLWFVPVFSSLGDGLTFPRQCQLDEDAELGGSGYDFWAKRGALLWWPGGPPEPTNGPALDVDLFKGPVGTSRIAIFHTRAGFFHQWGIVLPVGDILPTGDIPPLTEVLTVWDSLPVTNSTIWSHFTSGGIFHLWGHSTI